MDVYKQSVLGNAFGFTEDDLVENRQGRLSTAQIARLRLNAGRTAIIVIAILGGLGILSVVSSGPDPQGMPIFLFCLGMPALFTLAFTVIATEVAVSPRVVAKRSGMVRLAYGMFDYKPPLDNPPPPPQITPRRPFGGTFDSGPALDNPRRRVYRRFIFGRMGAYTMMIGDDEFRLSRDQWQLIKAGSYAAIYFLPTLHKIVSIEIIDSDIQAPEPPTIDVTAEPVKPIPAHGDNSDTGDVIRA
jgi:hypothetical protein